MIPFFLSLAITSQAFVPQMAPKSEVTTSGEIASERQTIEFTVSNKNKQSSPRYTDELSESPVTKTPVGTKQLYSRDAWGFSGYGSRFYFTPIEGQPTHIVYCENGEAYIFNPYSHKNTETYLKGIRADDKIIVNLPQPIYQEEDWQNPGQYITYYAQLINVEVDGSGALSYEISDESEVTFSIDSGNVSLDLDYIPSPDKNGGSPYPTKVLGFVKSDGTWANYGDCWQNYTEFNGKIVEAPENLKTEKWAMTWDGNGKFVNIGFDGEDVYLQGYENTFPEAWIKGRKEDGKIIFPSNQYLGEIPNYHYIIFFGAKANEEEDMLYFADDITFEIEEEIRTIWCVPEDVMVSNAAEDKIFWYAYYQSPEFCLQPEDMDQTPPAPRFWGYSDYLIDYGYAGFAFYLDYITKDGYVLDTNDMSYEIEFDGIVETFTPEDYYMTETITRIPYCLNDGSITAQGAYHNLTLYTIGLESIGVRQYNVHDGVTYTSPTMTYYIETGDVTTSINKIEDFDRIENVKWFDLTGMEVTTPDKGIFIRVTDYSDGRRESHKVLIR